MKNNTGLLAAVLIRFLFWTGFFIPLKCSFQFIVKKLRPIVLISIEQTVLFIANFLTQGIQTNSQTLVWNQPVICTKT